jgi:hypothetical protein
VWCYNRALNIVAINLTKDLDTAERQLQVEEEKKKKAEVLYPINRSLIHSFTPSHLSYQL